MGHYKHYRISANFNNEFGRMITDAFWFDEIPESGPSGTLTLGQRAVIALMDSFEDSGNGNWKVDNKGLESDETGEFQVYGNDTHVTVEANISVRSSRDLSGVLKYLGSQIWRPEGVDGLKDIIYAVEVMEDIGSPWIIYTAETAVIADGHGVQGINKAQCREVTRKDSDLCIRALSFAEVVAACQ